VFQRLFYIPQRLLEIADSGICLAKAHNYIVIARHCAACPGIALDGLVPLTKIETAIGNAVVC
jgi:hypothetical protein